MMLNVLKASQSNTTILPIYISNTHSNQHKHDFDVFQAQQLSDKSKISIYYSNSVKSFIRSLTNLLKSQQFEQVLITSQYQYYVIPILETVQKRFSKDCIWLDGNEQSADRAYISININYDFLYNGQRVFEMDGKIYSIFRKRFNMNEFLDTSKHDSAIKKLLKLQSNTTKSRQTAKLLELIPIQEIKIENKYPNEQLIWKRFVQNISNYHITRTYFGDLFDFSTPSSSFMSPFISAGIVTTRQLIQRCKLIKGFDKRPYQQILDSGKPITGVNNYINELLWCEYCHQYWLTNQTQLLDKNGELRAGGLYNRQSKWKNNNIINDFEFGTLDSQFDLVNAAMNQLRVQGYMSNYLRMITASFCYQQQLDWRVVMQIFEKYLIDIQWSSNFWGWVDQYNLTAKQPRIFSIQRQTQKRDKDRKYRDKWLK